MLLVLLASCAPLERLRDAEAREGRGMEMLNDIAENPTIPNATIEVIEYALWALGVMFPVGGAAVAVRNKRSNAKKKTKYAELDARIEALEKSVAGGEAVSG